MNPILIGVVLIVLFVVAFLITAVLLDLPILGDRTGGSSSVKGNIRNIVESQRNAQPGRSREQGAADIFESAEISTVKRGADSKLTVRKRMKYAQWKFPITLFYVGQVLVSIFAFLFAGLVGLHFITQILCLVLVGPIFMFWLLNTAVHKRFSAFDADYPQLLGSVTGLLKTGMNPIPALEAAAAGLEVGSLVRSEIEIMIERLRLGVAEDRSIGSFGEDIYHAEIELFVQALLLSRQVGGNLCATLERLNKQVRRRQYFRKAAIAAVSMQRGSIWAIIGILAGMQVYLYFVYPEVVVDTLKDVNGFIVWQVALFIVLLGVYWVRQVTKIRV